MPVILTGAFIVICLFSHGMHCFTAKILQFRSVQVSKMVFSLAITTRFTKSRTRTPRVGRTAKLTISLLRFSLLCYFGAIASICSFEASDALATQIAFSNVSFSSLNSLSFTARSIRYIEHALISYHVTDRRVVE